MKRLKIYTLLGFITCAWLLAAGYGWSQDNMPMQPTTTFFQLNQPNPSPTLGKMHDNHPQSAQEIIENSRRQMEEQRESLRNYHWQIYQQIQNNIDSDLQRQQGDLDRAHQNK